MQIEGNLEISNLKEGKNHSFAYTVSKTFNKMVAAFFHLTLWSFQLSLALTLTTNSGQMEFFLGTYT